MPGEDFPNILVGVPFRHRRRPELYHKHTHVGSRQPVAVGDGEDGTVTLVFDDTIKVAALPPG